MEDRIGRRRGNRTGLWLVALAAALTAAAPLRAGGGKQQLDKFAASYDSLKQWQARAKRIREGILRGAKLLPPPPKCPLNPLAHGRRQRDGYSVENVCFESLEGFFVTGNLYRPLEARRSAPGVLCPHGHFGGGRFRKDMQLRCATLARMGAVVFAYDMVGWGESQQVEHKEKFVLALQLWNSIRAVDYLRSMKQVDPKRIAVTGASGGGTQTFYLAAVDDRVAVSVPVVMVSAKFDGGCNCESGMPVRRSKTHETNNAEIAALAAPRAQLLVSCGKDWTRHTPDVELPYIRNVYRLYGREKLIENLHLPAEGHNYGYSKRVGAYSFLAKHLRLNLKAVMNADGRVDEAAVTIEKTDTLRVFDDAHPRPPHALTDPKAVEKALFARAAI